MMNQISRVVLFVMCMSLSALSWAGNDEALAAYKRGDYATAAKEWRKTAESGNAKGQANLGLLYYNGKGVQRDYAEAVKWYTKAAEQGNAGAQSGLGWMYEHGEGVERDFAAALKWYTKAAQQGHAAAQTNLGAMYSLGEGVQQNNAEAVKWYTKAAEQGDVNAQVNLGRLYETGLGIEQNGAEALRWYTKAAEQGDAESQFKIRMAESAITINFYEIPGPPIPNEIRALTLLSANSAGCVDARQVELQRGLHIQTVTTEDFFIIYTIGCMKGAAYNPGATTGAMYTKAMAIVLNINTRKVRWGVGEDYSNAVNQMPTDELASLMKKYGYGG